MVSVKDHLKESPSATYAGLLSRILALVLDFMILSLVFFPVTKLVKGVWVMDQSDHQWSVGWFITDPLCMIFLGVIVGYFILLEGVTGATLGKQLVGIRVVKRNGEKPGLGPAIVRNLMRAVDALPAFSILGAALIVTSKDRTRLGDRVAGTRVIVRRH